VAYNIGAAYISRSTPNATACYRWIKTLASHPELFYAMPARHSQINNPALAASQGADVVALYKYYYQLLGSPDTIAFPASPGTFPQLIVRRWLFQAFDHYVLDGADLEPALQNAETLARGFLECTAKVPDYDATNPQNNYLSDIRDCAVKFDPSTAPIFGR
jgi:hypothetical protein